MYLGFEIICFSSNYLYLIMEADNLLMIYNIMKNCIEAFQQFLQQIKQRDIPNEAIQKASKHYYLKAYDITEITTEKAQQLFEAIQQKFYKKKPKTLGINWFENELRIFVWTLVCYVYRKGTRIEDLDEEDWNYFSTIFSAKDPKLFDYQCHSIRFSSQKAQLWVKDEDDTLFKIIKQKNQKMKWNEISKELFELSDRKYFRTPKQCRERWNNHLDPQKIKGAWKIPQCLKMFQFVRDQGKKWARLVKILQNSRDEHSIKNKFNSLYKKQCKMTPGYSEKDIYDVIVKRLKQALNNKKSLNNDTSFDINDIQQNNESMAPLFQTHNFLNRMEPENHPTIASFGEMMRRKLLNFGNQPQKSVQTQRKIINKVQKQRIPQFELQKQQEQQQLESEYRNASEQCVINNYKNQQAEQNEQIEYHQDQDSSISEPQLQSGAFNGQQQFEEEEEEPMQQKEIN